MIRVFISHVANESEIAIWIKKEIGELLKGAIQFFVSSDGEHLVGGDKWLDKILTELKNSHTVLVLCSEESVRRPWVSFEAGGAWMADKRVIPLCHGNMEPGKLPQPLAALQAYSLHDPKHIRQLVCLLAESTGIEPREFDADALVRTLPVPAEDSTDAKSIASSKASQSHAFQDASAAPENRIDQSDYEFDSRTGVHRHKVTRRAVCTNCLLEGRISPLS
ncbi:MAG TPA: toll/interleukin-1 receptor domain-containing protein [Sedimentisphaerales bacterium]|nr:toll/interleukin-1 receptor domain-containing protein [Sedimentisphaerales bacterium]